MKKWQKGSLVLIPAFILVGLGIYGHRIYERNLYDSLHEKMIYRPVDAEESAELSVDFSILQSTNQDIQAWIDIPGTNISYPVLQSSEEEREDYYLRHNLDRSYGYPGVIYMQKYNSSEYDDPVTILYGHNMRDGSMFAGLHKYKNGKFFEEHQDIEVYTPNGTRHYRVFAALQYDDRHILEAYDGFQAEGGVEEFVEECAGLADNVDYSVRVDAESKLLVLSTCEKQSDKRYLVVAVLEAE